MAAANGIKTGSKSAQNTAVAQVGVVKEIDPTTLIALVTVGDNDFRVRADMLRGKSAPPQPGEKWIIDQPYGAGWQFAVPVNWLSDLGWNVVSALSNGWSSVGSPNLPVGYMNDAGGWVTLCGKVTGGSANAVIFTLPSGYRPGGTWTQLVPAGSGSGQLTIDSSGNVKCSTATSPVSLDAVRFLAAS